MRDLNRLYRELPALHELDYRTPQGSSGSTPTMPSSSVFVISAPRPRPATTLVVVICNFTPVPRHGYRLGVPRAGRWRERFNSDARDYGGSGLGNAGEVHAAPEPAHGHPASLRLLLPPLATLIFSWEPDG